MSREICFLYKGSVISDKNLDKLIFKHQPFKIETLIDTGTSRFFVIKNFTPNYFDNFSKLTLEHEPPIVVRGNKCNQRRNIGFFSEKSEGYRYSGQIMKSQPLDDQIMINLLAKVNKTLDTTFNGLLVNEYIDGTKTVGKHSDSEAGLDKKKMSVAGIAYGATRIFRIRDIKSGKIVLDYEHEPCSLIVMDGDFQKEFTHEIPPQKKVKESRISLTFRHHLT